MQKTTQKRENPQVSMGLITMLQRVAGALVALTYTTMTVKLSCLIHEVAVLCLHSATC